MGSDYAATPERFDPADVVIDVGSHIGGFCRLAAERGAGKVLGYEASRENFAIAKLNLAGSPAEPHHAAVWRSDTGPGRLRFMPHPDSENTGGGSVLATWWHRSDGTDHPPTLSEHDVETIALDRVLGEHERVRVLKIDVEGAEFPILLTSGELGRVEAIVGEYHEFSDVQMTRLPPSALVGDHPYTWPLLERHLRDAGFRAERRVVAPDRGVFCATRPGTVW